MTSKRCNSCGPRSVLSVKNWKPTQRGGVISPRNPVWDSAYGPSHSESSGWLLNQGTSERIESVL
jgi:hypothetical protein